MPQEPTAAEGLTVRDLVAQGRCPYQNWLQQWSGRADSRAGYSHHRDETDGRLLDEPTTFLDLAHQIEVLDLLYELNQSEGRTIVMVLHDLNQACRYADRLVAVKKGRVFAQGEPEAVMTEEMVYQVFGLECRIVADPVVGTPMCVAISRTKR